METLGLRSLETGVLVHLHIVYRLERGIMSRFCSKVLMIRFLMNYWLMAWRIASRIYGNYFIVILESRLVNEWS
jgi:hypothetical protein